MDDQREKIKETVIWMAECGWSLSDVCGAFESSQEIGYIKSNWFHWQAVGLERKEKNKGADSNRISG